MVYDNWNDFVYKNNPFLKEKLMKTEKKYNPSFGQGFTDERFKGAIVVTVTPEDLDSLVKNVQVGSKLLIRYNKDTKYGNKHYFTEILPPFKGEKKAAKKAEASDLD